MRRQNAQTIGDLLRDFWKENAAQYEKILQIRVQRGWTELLGPMIGQYTRNLYVKNHILYVSLTSSVLRNELLMSRENLIKSLNKYAGYPILKDIVIR